MTFDFAPSMFDMSGMGWESGSGRTRGGRWAPVAMKARRATSVSTVEVSSDIAFKGYADASVVPGVPATLHVLEEHKAHARLVKLVQALCADAALFGEQQSAKHVSDTCAAGVSLLKSVPLGRSLPKVSLSGEGTLLFLWLDSPKLVVTIDGWCAHFVVDAGSPNAVYHDDVAWVDGEIPAELLASILAR